MSTITHDDRRRDLLLREIVNRCQPSLEQRGFQLDGRGNAGPRCWVRFGRDTQDGAGHPGTLVLLVAHDREERAVLVESRFADRALQVQTPRRKRIHRYEAPRQMPAVAQETVAAVSHWLSAP
ncbi:MAG TPA: hypothetical protein VFE37_25215 [Chloroflexota bacterium]|nr:hypothetical protein [Chloroflexota bacterium]